MADAKKTAPRKADAKQGKTQGKKAKKLVKFGGGFYCGLIESKGKPSLYVFNGFFMSMRSSISGWSGRFSSSLLSGSQRVIISHNLHKIVSRCSSE